MVHKERQASEQLSIKSVGVCLKPEQPQAADAVNELVRWLRDRQIEVYVDAGCPASVGVAL